MKKLIPLFFIAISLISTELIAQVDTVTIRELNTYEDLTEFSESAIEAHPLEGVPVQFTAVVVSYPKSSGLANPDDDDNDGVVDGIGRVHVFVIDTSAASMGRDGMSIQIVEGNYRLMDGFTRGDVLTVTGDLGFFSGTAQFDVETVDREGNVFEEFPHLAGLVDPWEVDLTEINIFEENSLSMNIDNYGKYNNAYIKLSGAIVSNVSTGDRPNWAVNKDNSRIYVYDTSLRFRNDHAIGAEGYLVDYNARRVDSLDGEFVPPAAGADIDISGYLTYSGDDPDGIVDGGAFSINPFEDGVVWLNNFRFVDGVDGFEWPNDVVVNGLPPIISDVSLSDSSFVPDVAITVSATIVGAEGATVTAANLIYTAAGVTDTLAMTANGDEYSATLPAFSNFTPVSFIVQASDDNGITGSSPIAGSYSFIIQTGAIPSISILQKTGDGSTGASPLAGRGSFPMDITATVVSAFAQDGIIVIQDNTEMWSGIYIESTSATQALNRGDVINITQGEVVEVPISDFGISSAPVSQLVNTTFTVENTGTDIEALIPSLFTADVVALQAGGEIEPYEGMVVKFENAKLVSVDSFGEFQIANLKDGETEYPSSGMIVNEDMRLPFGDTDFPGDANRTAKDGVIWDAVYGIVSPAFGNGLVHPRGVEDLIADNWSNVSQFDLIAPGDSAVVVVETDIQVTWEEAFDYDNDPVTYTWTLYNSADTSVVVSLASDNEGVDPMISLDYATVDGLLASAGLENGQTGTFFWDVVAASSLDTTTSSLNFLSLTKAVEAVSSELDYETPARYSLEQNYPNPFNPSTNINFAIPQASKVTLTVYDMLGRKVATLIDGEQLNAANHSVRFNASALASGMYIYRIEAGNFVSTRKMMLIK